MRRPIEPGANLTTTLEFVAELSAFKGSLATLTIMSAAWALPVAVSEPMSNLTIDCPEYSSVPEVPVAPSLIL
jgi:hypothetical protein